MATTRIMPVHVGKGRTESRAISDIIDYVVNPQKTDNGMVSRQLCIARMALPISTPFNGMEEARMLPKVLPPACLLYTSCGSHW